MKTLLLILLSVLLSVQSIPVVIGHRGASGHRPENTLASFDEAIRFKADFVETDVVSTKDHVLVASHNPDITHNTDVADREEFASRHTIKNISGETYEGFFIEDFTLAELQSLRCRERYPFRNQSWNDMFPMPTLEEYLRFIKAKEVELNKKIGIYVETKHPSHYRSRGLPLEELLVETLHKYGYRTAKDLAFIQSFESNLKTIRQMTELPLVQLISGVEGDRVQYDTKRRWRDIASAEGLKEVATYAQGVGPHKTVIFSRDSNGAPIQSSFLSNAKELGLTVHVWTFRKEREHFEKYDHKLFGTVEEELRAFLSIGIDGVFTDQPDIGVEIRDEMFLREPMFAMSDDFVEMWTSVIFSLISAFGVFKVSRLLRVDKMDVNTSKTIQEVKDSISNSS